MRLRSAFVLAVLVIAPLATSGTVFAQARGDEIFGEFREGVRAFDEGRYEEAIQHFQRVLALQPSSEEALRMRDEAGFQTWVQMMMRQDDLGAVARHILRLAERSRFLERTNETEIRRQLEALRTAPIQEQWRLIEELVARSGPFVVPHVVEVLGDRRDNEWRITVFQLLSRLGGEGVLPVIEILDSDDQFTRQNAAAILGHLQDIRAVPALKAITEDASEEINVREEAFRALSRITGREATSLPSAQEAYLQLAEAYYLEEPFVVRSVFQDRVVWKWQGGRLTFRVVPDFMWNEEIAEELCYDGLAIDPTYEPLWVLLINVLYAQLNEVNEILAVAREKQDQGLLDQDALQELTAVAERQHVVSSLESLTAAAGRELLYRGLQRALEDRQPLVAVSIIRAIEDLREDGSMLPSGNVDAIGEAAHERFTPPAPPTGTTPPARTPSPASTPSTPPPASNPPPASTPPSQPPPSGTPRRPVSSLPVDPTRYHALLQSQAGGAAGAPLLAALRDADKRVRYEAAIALARLNPTTGYGNMQEVVQNLADAVGESGSRVILVVHEDENVRNRLVSMLEDQGFTPFSVGSGAEGLLRARAFPAEDAVLCSATLPRLGLRDRGTLPGDPPGSWSPEPFIVEFINELREDYRTNHVPVLAIAAGQDAEATRRLIQAMAVPGETSIDPVVDPNIDRALIGARLGQLFQGARYTRDAAARSTDIARRAAEALATLEIGRTNLQIQQDALKTALIETLDRQPDEVRIPCMHTLGNLQAREATDRLLIVYSNRQNSRGARVAAAWALGEIWKGGAAVSDAAFGAMLSALDEDDPELYEATCHALGKAHLTAAQRLRVFEAQRVE